METDMSSDGKLSSGRPRHLKLLALATCIALLSAAGCGGGSSSPGFAPVRSANASSSNSGTGPITEYTISLPHAPRVKPLPIGITNGPDEAIWFAERGWGRRAHHDRRHDYGSNTALKNLATDHHSIPKGS